MKKTLLLTLSAFLVGNISAQTIFSSNFENWNATNDSVADFMGINSSIYPASATQGVMKVATGGVYGPATAQLMNTSTSHKRLMSNAVSVTEGTAYDIKFWAKGTGELRSGLYDNDLGNNDFGYKYGSYVVLNSPDWAMYSQQIIADTTTNMAEFILSLRSTTGSHVEVDSFVVSVGTILPPATVSIYEIQYTTATTGDSPMKDQFVNVGGIVSATSSFLDGYWIQDNSGAYNGIFVYDSITPVAIGDSVTLTAKVVEKFSKTELNTITNAVIVNSGNAIHAAAIIATVDVSTEAYESVFIRIENAQVTQNLTFGRFNANDGSGDAMVDDFIYFYPLPTQFSTFDYIQGVLEYSYSEYKIAPRMETDMFLSLSSSVNENSNEIVSIYPNEVSTDLTIENANGTTAKIISIEGKEMNTFDINASTFKVNVANYNSGIYFLQLNGKSIKFVKK